MFILKIGLFIALSLLILILILLFLLIFCKTTIYIESKENNAAVFLKIFLVRIKLYPTGKAPKAEKPQEKPDNSKAPAPKDYSFFSDLPNYIDLILEILYDLKEKLTIDKLYLNIIFAGDDAAETGIMLGAAFSLFGMLTPVLETNFHIKEQSVVLDADFNSSKTKFSVNFIGHTRIIRILSVIFKYRKHFSEILQKT